MGKPQIGISKGVYNPPCKVLNATNMVQEIEGADPVFSWKLPERKYLVVRLYSTDAAKKGLSLAAKIGIGVGATALGIGGAVIAAPFVLAGVGFTASGVAAGSLAAVWQSTIGSVAAGSFFASLQSAGAAGLGAAGFAAASAAGGAVGAAAGAVAGVVITGSNKKSIPVVTLEEAFKSYVQYKYDVVSYEDLKNIVADLDLGFSEEELKKSYVRVTGRSNEGFITYEEFLRIFGVKLLKGQELENKLTKEFMKKANNVVGSEISFEQVKEMLNSLGAEASMNDIQASYAFVTNNEGENVKPGSGKVTLEMFLQMCGCRWNQNFDIEKIINFYEGHKSEDGKIGLKDLFTAPSPIPVEA